MVLFGYDPILNKKEPHNKLLSVLQKFLLKTKIYKLIAGNCGSSIYC